MFQVSPDQTEGRYVYELGNRQWDIPKLRRLLEVSCTRFLWTRHCRIGNARSRGMDKEIEGTDVAVGAVGSEGERRSSTLSMARDEGSVAALAPGQRWSLSRKRDVVLRLMQGEPAEGLSRRLGLPSL